MKWQLTGCLVGLALPLLAASGCKQTDERDNPNYNLLSEASTLTSNGDVTDEQKLDVQIALARSLEQQGQTDDAIKLFKSAIGQDDTRVDAYHRLAVLYDKKGDCQASEEYYQKALKLAPESAEIHCDFGYSRYLQRRWGESEASLRKALTLNPDLPRAHNNLGLLLARNRKDEAALKEFAAAGCDRAESHANMAFAMMLDQRWDESKSQLELSERAGGVPNEQLARVLTPKLSRAKPPAVGEMRQPMRSPTVSTRQPVAASPMPSQYPSAVTASPAVSSVAGPIESVRHPVPAMASEVAAVRNERVIPLPPTSSEMNQPLRQQTASIFGPPSALATSVRQPNSNGAAGVAVAGDGSHTLRVGYITGESMSEAGSDSVSSLR